MSRVLVVQQPGWNRLKAEIRQRQGNSSPLESSSTGLQGSRSHLPCCQEGQSSFMSTESPILARLQWGRIEWEAKPDFRCLVGAEGMTGWEDTASICARGGSGLTSGRISSQKELYQNKLLREVVESPLLEVFKKWLMVGLSVLS